VLAETQLYASNPNFCDTPSTICSSVQANSGIHSDAVFIHAGSCAPAVNTKGAWIGHSDPDGFTIHTSGTEEEAITVTVYVNTNIGTSNALLRTRTDARSTHPSAHDKSGRDSDGPPTSFVAASVAKTEAGMSRVGPLTTDKTQSVKRPCVDAPGPAACRVVSVHVLHDEMDPPSSTDEMSIAEMSRKPDAGEMSSMTLLSPRFSVYPGVTVAPGPNTTVHDVKLLQRHHAPAPKSATSTSEKSDVKLQASMSTDDTSRGANGRRGGTTFAFGLGLGLGDTGTSNPRPDGKKGMESGIGVGDGDGVGAGAGDGEHVHADDPGALVHPAGHAKQLPEHATPVMALYVLAEQLVQVELATAPSTGEYVPTGHSVHPAAPVDAPYVPAGQVAQNAMEGTPVPGLYVPVGQAAHPMEAFTDPVTPAPYKPAAHAVQKVAPGALL